MPLTVVSSDCEPGEVAMDILEQDQAQARLTMILMNTKATDTWTQKANFWGSKQKIRL